MLTKRLLPLTLCLLAVPALVIVVRTQTLGADRPVLTPPARRAQPANAPPLRILPASAEDIVPVTLEVMVRVTPRHGTATRETRLLARTKDRVYMKIAGKEWLFERNTVDRQRASALLVVHRARTIVQHEESDLRNILGIHGWVDILTLGVELDQLDHLKSTAHSRTMSGLTFQKRQGPVEATGIFEVWWNDSQLLPSKFVSKSRTTTTELVVTSLRRGADETLLQSPVQRYPQYKVVDLADWLEGH